MSKDPAEMAAARERLEKLSHWLDQCFTLPGTRWKFGFEALLGLIPVAGDLAGLGLSLWTLGEAQRAGAPKPLLWRMAGNAALDAGLGALPVVGDLFDFFFKANRRNLELLRQHLDVRLPHAKRSPWRWLVLAVLLTLGLVWWWARH